MWQPRSTGGHRRRGGSSYRKVGRIRKTPTAGSEQDSGERDPHRADCRVRPLCVGALALLERSTHALTVPVIISAAAHSHHWIGTSGVSSATVTSAGTFTPAPNRSSESGDMVTTQIVSWWLAVRIVRGAFIDTFTSWTPSRVSVNSAGLMVSHSECGPSA